jgi:hypothetical protein
MDVENLLTLKGSNKSA